MIIFVEDTNIQELTALFNNETNSFDLNNKPNIVYNLSSTSMMGIKVGAIVPPYTSVDVYDDKTFDIQYANYLLNDNNAFITYMQMIYNHYLGYNIFIIVGTAGYRERITASFMKFIQQRYAIIPRYIQSFEDIPDYYEEDMIYVDGIFNMDNDKERYIYLTSSLEQLKEEMDNYE